MSTPFDLDQYVARLASIPSFNIHAIDEKGGDNPWYEVTGAVVEELRINETALGNDVAVVSVQIMHWGRLEALAKRVWEVTERRYRQWRDGQILLATTAPPDDPKWKRPPEYQVEATYRAHRQYGVWQEKLERAEEAFNCARVAREAFLAKRDMLRVAVMRAPDGSGPRLAV